MAVVADRAVVRDREIGVVECGAQPTGGRVAGVARLRVACRDVVRHRAAKRLRAEPCGLVASITGCVRRGQAVIVADVAIRAARNLGSRGGRHLVRAGERPTRGGVIKCSRIPRRGVMASGAKRTGKICRDVIWNYAAHRLRAVPLIQMAAVATRIRAGEGVVVVDMAGRARRRQVIASERPAGRGVIKIRRAPTRGRVAGRAIRKGESPSGRGVHGRGGLLPGSKMAAGCATGRRRNLQIKIVAGVTIRARRNLSCRRELMQVLQRKAGGIVAPGGSPIRRGMATGAL